MAMALLEDCAKENLLDPMRLVTALDRPPMA